MKNCSVALILVNSADYPSTSSAQRNDENFSDVNFLFHAFLLIGKKIPFSLQQQQQLAQKN
jgi:hypothetical protein